MKNIPTIIYVDDSVESLRLIEIAAGKDERFNLELTTDGKDFMSKIQEKEYAAALIDLNLGVALSGTILAEKIHEIYPTMPIVIYTGHHIENVKSMIKNNSISSDILQIWVKEDEDVDTIADRLADLVK